MILTTAIAAIFTVASLVNTVADTAGLVYDNVIIGESLSNMNNTAGLLREKARQETDPVKKEIKLKMAEKLSGAYDSLSKGHKGESIGVGKKIGSGIGKMVLGEVAGEVAKDYVAKHGVAELGHYGAYMAGKTIAVPVAIADGILENALMAKDLLMGSSADVGKDWAMLATSSDGIDTQIEMIKAKDLLRKTDQLGKDLDQMMKDFGIDPDNPEGSSDDTVSDNGGGNDGVVDYVDDWVPSDDWDGDSAYDDWDYDDSGDPYGAGDYGYDDDIATDDFDDWDTSDWSNNDDVDYYDTGLDDQYDGWGDYYDDYFAGDVPTAGGNTSGDGDGGFMDSGIVYPGIDYGDTSQPDPVVPTSIAPDPTPTQPVVDDGPCDMMNDPFCGMDVDNAVGW